MSSPHPIATASMLFLLAAPGMAGASGVQTVEFTGVARKGDQIAYVEKHDVKYDASGRLLEAHTRYEDPSGKQIAELDSDFRESLTVPTHLARDLRSGNIEGIRRESGAIVLFDQDPGKPERTRVIRDTDATHEILVGCQGLNYYLLGNLERIDPESKVPIRFLIPGRLDTFDFALSKTGESPEGIVDFEVTVQNWLLKLFAPKLYLKYDKNTRRLLGYRGISNIPDDRGRLQNVTITYEYPK